MRLGRLTCLVLGPAGGIYHGRLALPPSYPFAPPEVYVATASGRFETNTKICLSISSFHPESWQPSWGVRTALLALVAFFDTEAKGAVGSLDAPPAERRRLAAASHQFRCPGCPFVAKEFEGEAQRKIAEKAEEVAEAEGATSSPVPDAVGKSTQTAPASDTATAMPSQPLFTSLPSAPQQASSIRAPSRPRGPTDRDAPQAQAGIAPAPTALFRHTHHPALSPSDPALSLPSTTGDAFNAPQGPATPHTGRPPSGSPGGAGGPGVGQPGAPPALVHVPTAGAPRAGVVEGGAQSQVQVGVVVGMEGGSPLWIDRMIVVCLMGLLALVVRKLA